MSPDTTRQAPGRTLLILGFGTLAFVLAQTTVIPALGDLQRELGASPSGIAWMVTAYLLVASIATPIFGRLGDMFGKQRLLAISLALFAVGSVVAGLADSLPLMIVGRGLQAHQPDDRREVDLIRFHLQQAGASARLGLGRP